MSFDITIWGALVAGLISFLSPCVLPLVPAYLGFLGGTTIDQISDDATQGSWLDRGIPLALLMAALFLLVGILGPYLYSVFVGVSSLIDAIGHYMSLGSMLIAMAIIVLGLVFFRGAKQRVLLAAVFFVFGLTAVFVTLGAASSFIGGFLAVYKNELGMAAGVLIIIFGLHFLGVIRIPLLYRSARVDVQMEGASLLGAFLMGMAFAFGWTPCVGPVLAPILMLAGSSDTLMQGVGLLFIYAMGLGIPFVLAAVAVTPFMGFMTKFRKHMHTVEIIMGILLVITGVLFITGSFGYFGINSIGVWLIDLFPFLTSLG